MGFDGDYQTEKPEFDTIEEAWEYSNDLDLSGTFTRSTLSQVYQAKQFEILLNF